MFEEEICLLREKLHFLINEKADYNEVLKVSQELDYYISEFITEKLNNSKPNNQENKKTY